jgi:two-component system response regulator FixJ
MSSSQGQNVYIVDDDDAARESISTLLTVVGFATRVFASGREFLASAKTLAPGCLVSDVRMPELDGLALLEQLALLKLNFPVVFVTGHGDVRTAVRAVKSGAVDFVEKPFDGGLLISAVRRALGEISETGTGDVSATARAKAATLSTREYEVFERLVRGMPNKSIARDLRISPRTVEFHRSRVMAKMQASSLSALVRFGLAAGVEIDV